MFQLILALYLLANLVSGDSSKSDFIEGDSTRKLNVQAWHTHDVSNGDYAFVVALAVIDEKRKTVTRLCTGSMIHKYWVLSAAHCFYEVPDRKIHVWYGNYTVSPLETKLYSTVLKIYIHPDYHKNGFTRPGYFFGDHDLSLLRVGKVIMYHYATFSTIDNTKMIGLPVSYIGGASKKRADELKPHQIGEGVVIKCDQPPKRKISFIASARMINPCERRSVACLLLAIIAVVAAASYDRERLEIAKQILEEVPLTDGHNDLPWNIRKFLRNQINEFELNTDLTIVEPWSISKYSHTDLPRLKTGMVGAQFWSAFVPCATQNKDAVQLTLEQIDVIKRLVEKYPQHFQFATSVKDILEAHNARPRKIASLIGIEGGHSIANSLGVLRSYYLLGVRYMTLTHTCNTPWADSSNEAPAANGLTEFGEKVVREMNRLGMIVDLSHVGENTTRAAIKLSKAPVIFSHSSVYSLCNHKRNVPDDIIKSVKQNGGLIMVNFFPDFVKCAPNATISDVAEHFHYIKRMIGADYVGIGGDFDGVNRVPRGLEDVSRYPELFAELLRSGQWNVQELKNVAGLNMLRVMRQVEKVRDEMRTNGVEPEEHPDSPNDNGNCTSNAFYAEYV